MFLKTLLLWALILWTNNIRRSIVRRVMDYNRKIRRFGVFQKKVYNEFEEPVGMPIHSELSVFQSPWNISQLLVEYTEVYLLNLLLILK